MNYRYVDMKTYQRKSHFDYFINLGFPYVGVTVNTDITELLNTIKAKQLPFFFTICYSVSRAANQIAEFIVSIYMGRYAVSSDLEGPLQARAL